MRLGASICCDGVRHMVVWEQQGRAATRMAYLGRLELPRVYWNEEVGIYQLAQPNREQ